MRLDQAMSTPAVTIEPTTGVKDAAELLATRGFTVLPVVDGGGEMVGIVSEGDLIQDRFPRDARAPYSAEPVRLAGATVADVMTREVITASLTDDVRGLIGRMRAARVRAVPVCHRDRVVGVVTYRDLVSVLAREDELIAADVRRKLGCYSAASRFQVAVHAGMVELTDRMDRPAEWYTAARIAEQIPGVLGARVVGGAEPSNG